MKSVSLIRTMAVLLICTSGTLVMAKEKADKDHPRREEVNSRVRREERRIEKGLKDGSITPEQAQKLRGELSGLKAQEKGEVKANGGYLTKPEQKQLNQELNQDGRQISKDEKHPRIHEVNGRTRNQEKRITDGVEDGKLTADQAKTLRGEEAGVKAEEHAEVKANGGHLTKAEQKQLNQELNQDSKQISTDEK